MDAGLQGSMGRVAAARDNAAMESFFSLVQKNVLDRQAWATRDQLHNEIVYWIEHTYNRRRRQRALGRLTPVEYRTRLRHRPRRRGGMITYNHRQPVLQQTRSPPSDEVQSRSIG